MKIEKSYGIGAMLYTPANNKEIVWKLLDNSFGTKFSLAFCLEDTIPDDKVAEAERILVNTIQELYKHKGEFYLPPIFIRVRRPKQISNLMIEFGKSREIIWGFNAPKFDDKNMLSYCLEIEQVNNMYKDKIWYLMPILESKEMVSLQTRHEFLYRVKKQLDDYEKYILGVRVGGNDLSHLFAIRRHSYETWCDLRPVADILTDILTVFSMDYVVSGPVWEYYNGENWDIGLAEEVRKDLTAGFVGKTVIHPKQIEVFNNASKVLKEDHEDALEILNWDKDCNLLVSGSSISSRMNERNTHSNWARKILALAKIYGTK